MNEIEYDHQAKEFTEENRQEFLTALDSLGMRGMRKLFKGVGKHHTARMLRGKAKQEKKKRKK